MVKVTLEFFTLDFFTMEMIAAKLYILNSSKRQELEGVSHWVGPHQAFSRKENLRPFMSRAGKALSSFGLSNCFQISWKNRP